MGTVHLIPSSDSEAISFFQAQSTFTELLPSARHSLGGALGGGVGRAEPEETKENQSLLLRNLRFTKEPRFDPRMGKIPWRREWLPTPVFLPGESHGQKSLGVAKESETT